MEETQGAAPVVEGRRGEKGAEKTREKDSAARVPSDLAAAAKKGREDTAGQARAEWLEGGGANLEEDEEEYDSEDEDEEA